MQLAPNSVGFIDAKSGRITRSFSVGREPRALTVANDSVWVANYHDQTVTRIDRTNGPLATIPVGGHPTGLTANRGTVWVWTLEGKLVPVDPRYDRPGNAVSLAHEIAGARPGGGVTAGGGFLWIAAPPSTVLRVDPANPRTRSVPILPDDGVQGAITYRGDKVWVAGASQAFPIAPASQIPGAGAIVGVVRDLAFGAGDLWVVSGAPGHQGGVAEALRRVDRESRLIELEIPVGSDPVAVAVAAGSVWAASRSDGTVYRVEPTQNKVVEMIRTGASPTALAADADGVWVAVR
jgi:YVTN family beta-propeller protein